MVTVYFVHFEIETYVPITKATIISNAWEKWIVTEDSEVSRLINVLSSGDEDRFDDKRVRCVVLFNNDTYYIDSNGVVSNGELSFQINKALILNFLDSLNDWQRKAIKNAL